MNKEDFQIINKIYKQCNKFNKVSQVQVEINKF